MNKAETNSSSINLVYDKACPVCEHFSCSISKNAIQEVVRIDGRQSSPLLQRAENEGFDIDKGIVAEHGGQLFFADKAMLTLCQNSNKWFYKVFVSKVLFRFEWSGKAVYTICVFTRRILLGIRGVPLINANK